MVQPVTQPPDLVKQVYDSLRQAICEGQLLPGQRLNQDRLAAQLRVSRQPVGQALQVLKSQGFVKDTGRRGVEIASLGTKQIVGIYQIRAALDALAAREAAMYNPSEALEHGPQLIEVGREVCVTGTVYEMVNADMEFHRFIYKISGNPVIDQTVAPHWHHLIRIMGQVIQNSPPRQKIWDEHAVLLDAIGAGDVGLAQTLAREHGEKAAAELVAIRSKE